MLRARPIPAQCSDRALSLCRALNLCLALCICCATCAAPAAAQTAAGRWDSPAADLARQIAAIAGPGPATLAVQNASSTPADQVAAIRRLLETDLRGGGVIVRAAADGAAIPTALRVTLSENARQGVWVAEVQQGEDTRVAMVAVALSGGAGAPAAATMTLRKTLLLTGAEQILDAQMANDAGAGAGGELLVLLPTRIATYRQSAGAWQQAQSFAIAPALQAAARDPRGEIVPAGNAASVFLPGAECDSTSATNAGFAFTCRASDDPWPIGAASAFYNASRDYFSGAMVPATGAALPPFYSAAEAPQPGGTVTLLADIHGHMQVLDRGALSPLPGTRDWGSDIAAVHSGCAAGTQVLADGAGGLTQASAPGSAHDSLRAYEISGRQAQAVSAPLDLDGSVTALHSAADGTAAMVVVRSVDGYEVWRVALDCR